MNEGHPRTDSTADWPAGIFIPGLSFPSHRARVRSKKRATRAGNAVVETALMAPFIFLLFMGVFDFGFYAYAAISTEHAARVATLYTSSSITNVADNTGACYYALQALHDLPNVGGGLTTCSSLPVQVFATQVAGPDGAIASQVTIVYQTIPVFPIPGLMGQMTITRTAQMRVQS